MTTAVCPGSFDPVTYGHLDVIERTARMVDAVVVAVGRNSGKHTLFTADERVDMLREACASWPAVSVTLFDGLLVDFCRDNDIEVISKGLRSGGDFDYELQMAHMNHHLSGVDTVFVPTAARWSYVSSTRVRELATLGGDISGLAPPFVVERTLARVAVR